jgi:predicted TIM-barrel fold metal-dependent hydrolase
MSERSIGMRIDCHCHVFNNDCIPIKGLLQSRFGIAQVLLKRFRIDFDSLIGSLTDPAEKDSIRYLLEHPRDFIRFFLIGRKSIPEILSDAMERAKKIDVWVPLMMDTESAYERSSSSVSFEEQKRIMMEVTAKGRGAIMPFFAYDPRSRTVEAVRRAIEKEGFVGVKLYPPLGFKPCDNEDRKVEANLEALYEYCSHGTPGAPIPITAHCSWSDGVYSNRQVPGVSAYKEYYRTMAGPSHWKKVLSRNQKLKLNLAHFGGAGEWEKRARTGLPAGQTKNWADPIVELMKDYENVYTDLSFHGILLGRDREAYKRVMLERIAGVEERVLMGSDWYMSAIQRELSDYWSGFAATFSDLFDMMTGSNAARFLQSEATETFLPDFLSLRNGYDQRIRDMFHQ